MDEHRRPDINPDTYELIGGFRPRTREDLTIPGGDVVGNPGDVADTMVVALFGTPFPENEIPFTVTPGVQKWFIPDPGADCGGVLIDVVDGEPDPDDGVRQFGAVVSVNLKFVGEQDQRDPLSPVKAWTFAIFSDKDPDNEIEDGRESRDLSFFTDSPLPNEWEFRPEDSITFWVPFGLGSAPIDDFHPDSTDPMLRSIGCIVSKRLGNMTLLLRGRTTSNFEEYAFYAGTRKSNVSGGVTKVQIGEFGRQSTRTDVKFWFFIGGVGAVQGVPDYYWPNF